MTQIWDDIQSGYIYLARLSPTEGREQSGVRPVLVVSNSGYLRVIDTLAWVVPISTTDRGWSNHIYLSNLPRPSWAMTEQLRTISRSRLLRPMGFATDQELGQIAVWLRRYMIQ